MSVTDQYRRAGQYRHVSRNGKQPLIRRKSRKRSEKTEGQREGEGGAEEGEEGMRGAGWLLSCLRLQSTTHLPQVKGPPVVEAMAELGREDAVARRPVSHVSLCHRQVDSRSSEMMLGEILYFKEMQLGLCKKECKRKKQRRQAERAAWAAGNCKRRQNPIARKRAPEELEDDDQAERDRAEKEWKKDAIKAELQAVMTKKAELKEAPVEPKTEPVEGMAVSATFLSEFVVPVGFHMEGPCLVQDDKEPEATKNIDYELEYK
ncbi:hypothetical protein DFH08DRAFT_824902 [Mycena albidolilacea]|uniref:Uncharacterized protein n=1 Tax=Mycena albidolilacea TaxID=1033008 RepID=A0AAD7EAG0_9AGAR|nr:hypothetical protein DFH08DRAFT_824902 [Mycena albidolilacea]